MMLLVFAIYPTSAMYYAHKLMAQMNDLGCGRTGVSQEIGNQFESKIIVMNYLLICQVTTGFFSGAILVIIYSIYIIKSFTH